MAFGIKVDKVWDFFHFVCFIFLSIRRYRAFAIRWCVIDAFPWNFVPASIPMILLLFVPQEDRKDLVLGWLKLSLGMACPTKDTHAHSRCKAVRHVFTLYNQATPLWLRHYWLGKDTYNFWIAWENPQHKTWKKNYKIFTHEKLRKRYDHQDMHAFCTEGRHELLLPKFSCNKRIVFLFKFSMSYTR